MTSESVTGFLPRAGLGGLEKRFSKSILPSRVPQLPTDNHWRERREERKEGLPGPQAAYACAARPSAHALLAPVRRRALNYLAPRRHRPKSMLRVAPGDPLSQIFAVVFRLGP